MQLKFCFLFLLSYFVSSTSLYNVFPNSYCFPVNATLTCSSSSDCRDLCSQLGHSCCGFYNSFDNSFHLCSCLFDGDLKFGIYSAETSVLEFPVQNVDLLTCDQLFSSRFCNYHPDCEWGTGSSSQPCGPPSDDGVSAVFIVGIVFLCLCAMCTIAAGYYLYVRKLQRIGERMNLPPSPKRPRDSHESPRGDGPEPPLRGVPGEPGNIFQGEGEGKRHPHIKQGEADPPEDDMLTPHTPDGGGEVLAEKWTPEVEAVAIALPAEDNPGEIGEVDSSHDEPGGFEKRTPDREIRDRKDRESLVYRL